MSILDILSEIKETCVSEVCCDDCIFYKSGCFLGDIPSDWNVDEIVSRIDKITKE